MEDAHVGVVGRAQAMLRDRTGMPDEDWLDRQRTTAGKGARLGMIVAEGEYDRYSKMPKGELH